MICNKGIPIISLLSGSGWVGFGGHDCQKTKDYLNQIWNFMSVKANTPHHLIAYINCICSTCLNVRLLLWYQWTEFNETWQEVRSQHPLPSFMFFEPIEKPRWLSWLMIGWDIFDFSENAEWNFSKLDRRKDLRFGPQFSTKVTSVRSFIKGSLKLWFGIWVLYFHRMLNIAYQALEVDWPLTLSAKIDAHVTWVICY